MGVPACSHSNPPLQKLTRPIADIAVVRSNSDTQLLYAACAFVGAAAASKCPWSMLRLSVGRDDVDVIALHRLIGFLTSRTPASLVGARQDMRPARFRAPDPGDC